MAVFFGLLAFLARLLLLRLGLCLSGAGCLFGWLLGCRRLPRGILPINVGCRLMPMALVLTGRMSFLLPDLMCAVANALLAIVCHGHIVSIRADFSAAPKPHYSKQSIALQPSDVVSWPPA